MTRQDILGVPIDNLSMEEAVSWIDCHLQEFRQGSKEPAVIITPNPEMVVFARESGEFAALLLQADLLVPDGIGLLLAGRLLGKPLQERVSGIDLFHRMLLLAVEKGYGVYLLGAAPEVIEGAVNALQETYEGLQLTGYHHGYLDREAELAVLADIKQSRPDLLFVGMGFPRQEKFMIKYREELDVPVSIGIGGSFDVISGQKKRAPRWVQSIYLEWLYRLFQEPRRFFRMLAIPRFLWLILRDKLVR